MDEQKLICGKCKVPLKVREATLTYLGHQIRQDLPGCPVCGQVYLPEDLVKGKMHEVEIMLEDK